MDTQSDVNSCTSIVQVMEKLSGFKEVHALVDEVLLQARRMTRGGAGSIYLIENNSLNFIYIHNDTLLSPSSVNRILYQHHPLPGYVALTGNPVAVDDVYHLPAGTPFIFTNGFDQRTGYRTRSVLPVPLVSGNRKMAGVIEIINRRNDGRQPATLTPEDQLRLSYFANNAAAIERALLTGETIWRMIKRCELRNPRETGAHANRVGNYAAEVYHQWSLKRGVPEADIKQSKDSLRIAARLHDLGKVGISDLILKKPDRLDSGEFRIMQSHTILGARLFQDQESYLDVLSAEIALNHHEKWDCTGYPGKIDDIYQDQLPLGKGKRGEEIPISGRIVALADVYDALVTQRAYKNPWSEEMTLNYIKGQSGRHFDPDVVDAFLAIYDVIIAIRAKYQQQGSSSQTAAH